EIPGPTRIGKRQGVLRIVHVRDDATVRRHDPTQVGQDLRDDRLTIGHCCRDRRPAEERYAFASGVLLDELTHLVDGANAFEITRLLRLAPREEPVAAENQDVAAGRALHGALQYQRQLEA